MSGEMQGLKALIRLIVFIVFIALTAHSPSVYTQSTPLSVAQLREGVYRMEDLSRGFRFDPPLISLGQSPSRPLDLYVGNQNGRVFVSHDGGESWVEGSIRTARDTFLGATYTHQFTLNVDTSGFLQGDISPSPGQVFSFQELIDLDNQLPQAGWIIQRQFDKDVAGNLRPLSFLSEHQHERASWRLSAAVERELDWGIGVDWRELVDEKSTRDQDVFFLAPHPTYPNVIFAGTQGGLHRSLDAGDDWPEILSGGSRDERSVAHIAISPFNPLEVWVGTREGLRISTDGGETFLIPFQQFASSEEIRWIAFHPRKPGLVFVGLSWGMLKTTDGGKSFDVNYYEQWRPLSSIRQLLIDPYHPRRLLVGTDDGLMLSEDEGESFKRVGGLLFMERSITTLLQGFAPGHHFAATGSEIWQTFDGGYTWQAAFFSDSPKKIRHIIKSDAEPYTLLMLSETELFKLTLTPPQALDTALLEEVLARESREPTLSEMIEAALERAHVSRDVLVGMREQATVSALLPEVRVSYASRSAPIAFRVNNYLIGEDLSNFNAGDFQDITWGAFAWWDLQKLVFHRGALGKSRGMKQSQRLADALRAEVINLYKERRLLLRSLTLRPTMGYGQLLRLLRLEELTSLLNQLCGGRLPPLTALEALRAQRW